MFSLESFGIEPVVLRSIVEKWCKGILQRYEMPVTRGKKDEKCCKILKIQKILKRYEPVIWTVPGE
jgi:hypothetical protein